MDDKELELRELEYGGCQMVHFSARRMTVDDVLNTRINEEGYMSVSSNLMFGIKSDDYDPYVDEKGHIYFEFDSPYQYEAGDPIDEELWLKEGMIATVNGYYL
jgi:hypothetical protein